MNYYFIHKVIFRTLPILMITNHVWASDVVNNTKNETHISDTTNRILTIPMAIYKAVAFSPQIKSTEYAVDALNGTVQQARYRPNPDVGFDVDNIAGRGVYQGIAAAEYNLNISQQIEMGNKRNARIAAATASVNTAKINITTDKLDIKYAVEMLYLDILVATEQVKLLRLQKQMARKTLDFISKRVDMAAEHETQRSKANFIYKESLGNYTLAQQQLIYAKKKLAVICGYNHTNFDVSDDVFFHISPPSSLYYTGNIPNIPDLQKFDSIKKEKQAVLDLEKANAVPDPRITAGIRHFSDSSDQALMLGVSIPIAIYNKNQGNISRAYADIEQAEYNHKQAELTTRQILIDTHQELNNAYTQLDDIKKTLLPEIQKSFSLAKTAYMNDILSYIEVLDAQTTLFETKQKYIQILKQYHAAKIKISRLTGTV